MKLTVLVDNNTYIDQYYLGEPAVCYLIERRTDDSAGCGVFGIFIENAARMGIDLSAWRISCFRTGISTIRGLGAFSAGFRSLCGFTRLPARFGQNATRGWTRGLRAAGASPKSAEIG
jgi:7,8-dihydropterin-6-yl-methyl-4-(beta-D-ribofuranosyl)aminobenzene 5'-phosphate synthase